MHSIFIIFSVFPNLLRLFYATACMLQNNDLADDFANIAAKRKELFSGQSNRDQTTLKSEIEGNRRFQEWKRKTLIQEGANQGFEVQNMYEAIRHLARYHQINEFNSSNRASVNRAIDKLISDSYIDFNAGSSIHTALSYLTFPNNYIDFNRGFSIHNPLSHLMIPKKIIHEGRVQEVNANHLHDTLLEARKEIIKSAEAWAMKKPDDKEVDLYGLHNGYFVLGRDGKTIKYSYLKKNKRKFAADYETDKDYEINLID